MPRENSPPPARRALQAHQAEHLIDPAERDGIAGRQRGQVRPRAAARVKRPGLQQRADLAQRPAQLTVTAPGDPHRPATGPVQAQHQPHRGGLPRPVRPQEPRHNPGAHVEAERIHGGQPAVTFSQATHLNDREPPSS